MIFNFNVIFDYVSRISNSSYHVIFAVFFWTVLTLLFIRYYNYIKIYFSPLIILIPKWITVWLRILISHKYVVIFYLYFLYISLITVISIKYGIYLAICHGWTWVLDNNIFNAEVLNVELSDLFISIENVSNINAPILMAGSDSSIDYSSISHKTSDYTSFTMNSNNDVPSNSNVPEGSNTSSNSNSNRRITDIRGYSFHLSGARDDDGWINYSPGQQEPSNNPRPRSSSGFIYDPSKGHVPRSCKQAAALLEFRYEEHERMISNSIRDSDLSNSASKIYKVSDAFPANIKTIKTDVSAKKYILQFILNNKHDFPEEYRQWDNSLQTGYADAVIVTRELIDAMKR